MFPLERETRSRQEELFGPPNGARQKAEIPPLRLSPHSIALFRECRQQYKFHYIDKLADRYFRARPFFTMGNHVHATLRELLSEVPVQMRTTETSEKLLRRNWRRNRFGFRNEADEQRWVEKALGQLQRFVEEQDVTVQPLMVETSLEAEITPRVLLRGRVDRVDREGDGSLHIIDYKTGNMPQAENWSQLHLYALLLTRLIPRPVRRASFHYLSPGIVQSMEILPESLDQVAWELLVTAKDIAAEKSFRPTSGPHCTRCLFGELCPATQPDYSGDVEDDFELWREGLRDNTHG
jgi:RecB family exonuclease